MTKTILVLFHAREQPGFNFAMRSFEAGWRDMGYRVEHHYGVPGGAVRADFLFPQIDLTREPSSYVHYIENFDGVVVNRRIHDISKRRYSESLVYPGDAYAGPVIVKSDANHNGNPEWRLAPRWWRGVLKVCGKQPGRTLDYHVFANLGLVPRRFFRSKNHIVEKFLPEVEGAFRFLRMYFFLGDQGASIRLKSTFDIIKDYNATEREDVDTPGELVALRKRLGLDYGKIDYVIHEGRVVVLDINKTPAGSTDSATKELDRQMAKGILAIER